MTRKQQQSKHHNHYYRNIWRKLLVTTSLCALLAAGQSGYYTDNNDNYANDYDDYQDYGDQGGGGGGGYEDHLYHDYAARQQEKMGGGIGGGGGIGLGKLVLSSALSWLIGARFHSGRAVKKIKDKFQKEQKQLYSQYYNDVYKLTEQNQELQLYVEQLQDALSQTEAKHELEALQRDYDEFKQPDIDGDDRISRAEFNMYVQNYLSHYPGLSEKDYPKFEDFDHDNDGFVSFQEYAQQMALQVQQAELEAAHGTGGGNTKKAQALNELYSDATKGSNFNEMYKNQYNL